MVGDSLLFPETEWYKFLEESVFSMRRVESIKQTTQNKADGVIIYSVYRDEKEKKEKLVLIRQYRCPLDDYIYEFPAGLVDEGEDFKMAGMRELKEETGLDFQPIDATDMYTKPYFTKIGRAHV